MKTHTAFSAGTSAPNTAETDALPEVLHNVDVRLEAGGSLMVQIMASCPINALLKVERLNLSEVEALPRVS